MKRWLLVAGACLALGCGSSKGVPSGTGGTAGRAATGGGSGAGAAGTAGADAGGMNGAAGSGGVTGLGGAAGPAGGVAGTGGTGGEGGGATAGAGGGQVEGESVLERNKHASRDGSFLQPTLTRAKAATMALDDTFAANFAGNMWASPLYFEHGPNGKGVFLTVTTGNDVYALDETSGAQVWTKNIGPSPTANAGGCGNIYPLGILSTPVIDAGARRIFVAGAIGTTSLARHEVHALSVDDGSETSAWPPIDVSTMTSGGMAFMPAPQNQRSALSLVAGTLYVAYGGQLGDCGPYHGWVIGIDAQNPAMRGAWATGGQGEGIWAAGGMASDGTGVFALTGNNTLGTNSHLDSEEAVRVTGLGTLSDTFYPAAWRSMDANDSDLGANSPVYVKVPGATPSTFVVALSKDGHMYLLDSHHLGGQAGQVVDFLVAQPPTGNPTYYKLLHTAPATYTTRKGVYVVFSADNGAICPAGSSQTGGAAVVSILIPAGAPPAPQVAWCAPLLRGPTDPISTTTNGKDDTIVWYVNNGKLNGIDGDTGVLVADGGSGVCYGVRQWTSPIALKGRIVTSADGHLCSWSTR